MLDVSYKTNLALKLFDIKKAPEGAFYYKIYNYCNLLIL